MSTEASQKLDTLTRQLLRAAQQSHRKISVCRGQKLTNDELRTLFYRVAHQFVYSEQIWEVNLNNNSLTLIPEVLPSLFAESSFPIF